MPYTETAAYAPRVVRVPAPGFAPRPYGLFSGVTLVDFEDVHEANGVVAEPDQFASAVSLTDGCDPAEVRTKVLPGQVGPVVADPVTLFSGWECSPVGYTQDEINARSLQALLNGEERGLERWLATGESDNNVAAAAPWQVLSFTVADALAELGVFEETLALAYGGVGVLHVATAAIPALFGADYLEVRSGRLVSRAGGHTVVSNPYLVVAAGEAEIMLTGSITVRRGAPVYVGTFADSHTRSNNDVTRIVERTYVVLTDYAYEGT